jgi:hypothetical protein
MASSAAGKASDYNTQIINEFWADQSRISCRWAVSLQIVLSASPAEARASTNPASTSVSKPARSSSLTGAR